MWTTAKEDGVTLYDFFMGIVMGIFGGPLCLALCLLMLVVARVTNFVYDKWPTKPIYIVKPEWQDERLDNK